MRTIAYFQQIFIGMIREAGLYNEISQAYAGLDTNKAVGVMVSTLAPPSAPLCIINDW